MSHSIRSGVVFALLFVFVLVVDSFTTQRSVASLPMDAKQWEPFGDGRRGEAPRINVTKSDLGGCSFEVTIQGFYIERVQYEGEEFDRITVPGRMRSESAGAPELPVFIDKLAIPECDNVEVTITPLEFATIDNINLVPVPRIDRSDVDVDYKYRERFIRDESIYSRDEMYPDWKISKDDNIKIRGQYVVEISYPPFRYNPVTGEMRVITRYRIETVNVSPSGLVCRNVGPFTNICNEVLINYDLTAQSEYQLLLGSGGGTWGFYNSLGDAIGADYLIVAADQLCDTTASLASIEALAQKRAEYNGFNVAIVRYSGCLDDTGNGEDEKLRNGLAAYYGVNTAAHMQDGKLGYILLLGDDRGPLPLEEIYIPAHMKWDTTLGLWYADDKYYACLADTNDSYVDVFIGRMPVDDVLEVGAIIEKTIQYEPHSSSDDWSGRALFATGHLGLFPWDESYFESWKEEKANTFFGLYDCYFMDRYKMFDCTWNDTLFDVGEDGTAEFSDSLSQLLNDGYAYMEFLGHGTTFYFGSAFYACSFEDESVLHNEGKYPFILSLSCHVGWFDYQSGDWSYCSDGCPSSDSSDVKCDSSVSVWGCASPAAGTEVDACDCLVERLLNLSNRGAVAMVAPTQSLTIDLTYLDNFRGHFSVYYAEPVSFTYVLEYLSNIGSETCNKQNYFGDPALNIYWQDDVAAPSDSIDIYIDPYGFEINPSIFVEGRQGDFAVKVRNAGVRDASNVTIELSEDSEIIDSKTLESLEAYHDTMLTFDLTFNSFGDHRITATANPYNTIDEICYDNNEADTVVAVLDVKTGFPVELDASDYVVMPKVYNFLERDNSQQILVNNAGDSIALYNQNGVVLKSVDVGNYVSSAYSIPVGDVFENNDEDMVIISDISASSQHLITISLYDVETMLLKTDKSFINNLEGSVSAVSSAASLNDLDSDGDAEIVCISSPSTGFFYHYLRVYDYSDEMIQEVGSVDLEFYPLCSAVEDLDYDNKAEIVVGGHKYDVSGLKFHLKVFNLDSSGLQEIHHHEFLADCLKNEFDIAMSVADINADGYQDIVATGFGMFRVFSGEDFSLLSEQVFRDFRARNFVILDDWDSDGDIEILFTARGGTFSVYDTTTTCLPYPQTSELEVYSYNQGVLQLESSYIFEGQVESFLKPLVTDIDGDSHQEVIVGRKTCPDPECTNSYFTIDILNDDLTEITDEEWPSFHLWGVEAMALAVGDLEGDGKQEILMQTESELYALDIPWVNSGESYWVMNEANMRHTNCLTRYIRGEYSSALSLCGDIEVVGDVTVNSDMIIDAGTKVRVGEDVFGSGSDSLRCSVLVSDGGIFANGRQYNPISIASDAPYPTNEDWGPIVVLGTLEDSYLEHCSVSNALTGLMFISSGAVSLIDCDISACKFSGISIDGSTQAIFNRCTMSGNGGSGALIQSCGNVTIYDCQLMNNSNQGAYVSYSNATISNCTVTGNGGSYGIEVAGDYTYVIDSCMVSDNGSGIKFNNAGGLLSHSKVWDNDECGVVCVGATATPEITYTKITGNDNGVWVDFDANPILGIRNGAGRYNSIYDNDSRNVSNETDNTVMAESCWWNTKGPQEPGKIFGDVDYDPWLKKDPLLYFSPSTRDTRIFSLAQNYPNPLGAGSTNIRYSIPNDSELVSLIVYDVKGGRIRTLVNKVQMGGEYFVKWNGRNEHGNRVAPGIYFYRLKVGEESLAKKIIMLH